MALPDPNPGRGGGGGARLTSLDSLPPTPRTRITELNVRCKHLSLAEIMFTSLTTNYSKVMVQYELTDDTA